VDFLIRPCSVPACLPLLPRVIRRSATFPIPHRYGSREGHKQCRFNPGTRDGVPVMVKYRDAVYIEGDRTTVYLLANGAHLRYHLRVR